MVFSLVVVCWREGGKLGRLLEGGWKTWSLEDLDLVVVCWREGGKLPNSDHYQIRRRTSWREDGKLVGVL